MKVGFFWLDRKGDRPAGGLRLGRRVKLEENMDILNVDQA